MEVLGQVLSLAMQIAQMRFDVFGHSISMWNLWIYGAVVSIVAWAVEEVLLGD